MQFKDALGGDFDECITLCSYIFVAGVSSLTMWILGLFAADLRAAVSCRLMVGALALLKRHGIIETPYVALLPGAMQPSAWLITPWFGFFSEPSLVLCP